MAFKLRGWHPWLAKMVQHIVNRCTGTLTCIRPSPLREWMEPLAMKYSMDFVMLVVCLKASLIVTAKQRILIRQYKTTEPVLVSLTVARK